MTVQEVLERLAALGSEKVRTIAHREGAGDQFGVKLGDIRTLAKAIKTDHELALQLWQTGNLDARLLAVLILKPKALSVEELDAMVRSNRSPQGADWLNSYVVKLHPGKEDLREGWMDADNPMAARAGWSLTAERVARSSASLDLPGLLDRIEAEMAGADPLPRWTMNSTLAAIGIHHQEHRERALAIGERLGVYRDYPTAPGCTSPFAPIWINAMIQRRPSV